jgi:hypothetical protein
MSLNPALHRTIALQGVRASPAREHGWPAQGHHARGRFLTQISGPREPCGESAWRFPAGCSRVQPAPRDMALNGPCALPSIRAADALKSYTTGFCVDFDVDYETCSELATDMKEI